MWKRRSAARYESRSSTAASSISPRAVSISSTSAYSSARRPGRRQARSLGLSGRRGRSRRRGSPRGARRGRRGPSGSSTGARERVSRSAGGRRRGPSPPAPDRLAHGRPATVSSPISAGITSGSPGWSSPRRMRTPMSWTSSLGGRGGGRCALSSYDNHIARQPVAKVLRSAGFRRSLGFKETQWTRRPRRSGLEGLGRRRAARTRRRPSSASQASRSGGGCACRAGVSS